MALPLLALRAAIAALGMTQAEVALLTRISAPRLSRIIAGVIEPTPEERAALQVALSCPPEVFIAGARVEVRAAR